MITEEDIKYILEHIDYTDIFIINDDINKRYKVLNCHNQNSIMYDCELYLIELDYDFAGGYAGHKTKCIMSYEPEYRLDKNYMRMKKLNSL